jgi:hypothetical protein
MRYLILIAALLTPTAKADVNYTCVDMCLTQIDSWQFCQAKCTYDPQRYIPDSEDRHIDYDCAVRRRDRGSEVEDILESCAE